VHQVWTRLRSNRLPLESAVDKSASANFMRPSARVRCSAVRSPHPTGRPTGSNSTRSWPRLTTGSPTKPIRRQIAEVERAEAHRRQTEAEQEAIAADAIQSEGESLAGQAAQRLVEQVADPSFGVAEALAVVGPSALALAEGQVFLNRAMSDLADAQAAATEVESRLCSAAVTRADILTRRQTGAEMPDDGETVALLDLDSEGLRSLLADAQAIVGQRRGPVAECRALVARAAGELQLAEDRALLAALTVRADRLTVQMSDTLTRLDEARQRCGQRPTWSPGVTLYRQIRKAAAATGLL